MIDKGTKSMEKKTDSNLTNSPGKTELTPYIKFDLYLSPLHTQN